ncbi:flagellar assembly peptidoglycan hydrolase FlgJ [Halomonas daqiaonensis]|uniref:Peptidoglycan hydrolase FlgJ n=1 Tax=Halomonas daqiaonensis TaxID=650850 RepID=A0A1H7SP71_9GAMM|nr:flagellar assembly peptidoglycan hydrolase FlgJ [Halomonas daqiaonensis]SEL74440.1 flagellar protein FlgJ [Halomonas daqiaonensis]
MSLGSNIDGQFALDMQGLQRLKHTARQDPSGGAGEAAKQFEALFIQMMMKSMREAMPTSGLLDSKQTDFYQSLLDKQWSQTLANRGIGLADTLVAELEGRGFVPPQQASEGTDIESLIAGIPQGSPRVLTDAIQPEAADDKATMPQQFLDELMAIPAGASSDSDVDGSRQATRNDLPAHVQNFLDRLEAPAQAASRSTGVPAELILAQAALETGWGRHEIATRDGGNSYNLFGIKAGSRWQGETTEITTHEVFDGQRQRIRDDFRVYGSFEEAFTDYARLISENSRYAAVTTAGSAEQAAKALQQGGYATDPAYADKLIAVMDTMGPLGGNTTLASNGTPGGIPVSF